MINTYKKVDVARTQLETAIKIFFLGEDYFSVITLAGAAESIYGSILILLDKEPSLHSWVRTEKALYRALSGKELDENELRKSMNYVRNNIKHFNELHEQELTFDAKHSAMEMINRAVGNYEALKLPESNLIKKYEEYCEFCEN